MASSSVPNPIHVTPIPLISSSAKNVSKQSQTTKSLPEKSLAQAKKSLRHTKGGILISQANRYEILS
jgi:hypothetical protein